jgi:hypothetical protein
VALKIATAAGVDTLRELPEEYSWTGQDRSYVVCAFYTPNYLPQATSLITSLEAQGLSYFIKRVEHQGTWEATTRLKPTILVRCLELFPDKDALYLDADAVVRQPLTFLDTLREDVGILFHPTDKPGKWYLRLSAGTIFVRNTAGGRKFARLWADAGALAKPHTTDEDMIYMALRHCDGLSLRMLPQGCYKVFDKDNGVEPVIEHFQASRSQNNVKWVKQNQRNMRILQIGGGLVALAGLAWLLTRLLG